MFRDFCLNGDLSFEMPFGKWAQRLEKKIISTQTFLMAFQVVT